MNRYKDGAIGKASEPDHNQLGYIDIFELNNQ